MTRIAVVDNKKLKDMQLKQHIMKLCPVNRMGAECIKIEKDGRLTIDENLCTGCGICVKQAPDAIKIINLPEELNTEPIHRYGVNGFALYNLPIPVLGKVVGIIGRNGMGKSTAIKILVGELKPNLGIVDKPHEADYKALIEKFKGTQAQGFFESMRDGKITVAYKPQQVDLIPKQFSGTVRELLLKVDKDIDSIVEKLDLSKFLDSDIAKISGGELQRVAIAATVLKKANLYFFDEPTAYLDIKQRIRVAEFIRTLATETTGAMVIEHDLIILDYMTDQLHLMYGNEGGYGVVSGVKSTKNGINIYLDGYLKEENIRFRESAIRFEVKPPSNIANRDVLAKWESSDMQLGRFTLHIEAGSATKHATIGIVGENGTGKTTFVKSLCESVGVKVAYKPQYLQANEDLVMVYLHDAIKHFSTQLIKPLGLSSLFMRKCTELSGGELQRVEIARCLSQEADLYLLDEPSAYLDIEQRLAVSKVIRDLMFLSGKSALIVDHDILFIDYLSDRLMVFDGVPAITGRATGPFSMEEGMNRFLKDLDITFRRDEKSHCPRTNKKDSQLDKMQKHEGKLYYL